MTGKKIDEFEKELREHREITDKVSQAVADVQSSMPDALGENVPHFTRGVGGSVRIIDTGIPGLPRALVLDLTENDVWELKCRISAAKRLNMNVACNKELVVIENRSSPVIFLDENLDPLWGVMTEIVRPEREQVSEVQATIDFIAPLFDLALGANNGESANNGEQGEIAKEIRDGMTRDIGGVNGKNLVANLNPLQDPSPENEAPARVPRKKTTKPKGITNAEMRVKPTASCGGKIDVELRFLYDGDECFEPAKCVIQDDITVYVMASATQDWLPVILSGEQFSGSLRQSDVMIDGDKFLAGELLTNFVLRLVEMPAYSHMDPDLVIEFLEMLYSQQIT